MANYPVTRDLTVYSNERLYHIWQWKPGGVAVDFGGYTFACQVRADKNDRTSTVQADWDLKVTGDASGNLTLEVDQTTIVGYTWTVGWYDIVVTDASSNPLTLIAGSVSILEGMA